MGRGKRPSLSSGFVFNGVNGVLHIKYADRGREGGERTERISKGDIYVYVVAWCTWGAMCVSLMRLLITGHCH